MGADLTEIHSSLRVLNAGQALIRDGELERGCEVTSILSPFDSNRAGRLKLDAR